MGRQLCYPAVVTFDAVVGGLIGVVERIGNQLLDDGLEGLGAIGYDLVWFAVSGERLVEEGSGCIDVASG